MTDTVLQFEGSAPDKECGVLKSLACPLTNTRRAEVHRKFKWD